MEIDYRVMLRPAYEGIAAATWTLSAVTMSSIGLFSAVPSKAFVTMSLVSATMGTYRAWQAKTIWDYKWALSGKPFSFIDVNEILGFSKANPDHLCLGWGFDWQPSHSQAAYDMLDKDNDEIYPPKLYMKLFGSDHDPREAKGRAWIHGLEPTEEIITTPWATNEGHTALWGTTGAGKTRLYEFIMAQMIAKNDAIFVIDPKGDAELEELCKRVCEQMGHPERFIKFHPAFPSSSIRLDPLKNFNRGTEIASRTAELLQSTEGTDTFGAVTWDAINAISLGERYLGRRSTIASLLRHFSQGIDGLLEEVLRKYLNEHSPGWQTLNRDLVKKAANAKAKGAEKINAELKGAIDFYESEVRRDVSTPDGDVVQYLVKMYSYNREWLNKMVVGIIPILQKLNAEELGKMLSPDYEDIDDPRPIFDTQKIIEGRYVCYVGLDSLSDSKVGEAIGAILLSSIASDAGYIYNYVHKKSRNKVQLIIDEASEVVASALIQLLNKGRGAGFSVTMAAQLYSDYVHKMGSEPAARMLLGNCNNMITLRIVDPQTQQFIAEKFGETFIMQKGVSKGSGNRTEDHGLQFSGNTSENISKQKVPLIPQDLIGKLPDLQYFAQFAGGRTVKGRLAKVEFPEAA